MPESLKPQQPLGCALLLVGVLCAGCGMKQESLDGMYGPRLRLLGTAQDGGFPHVACSCPHCEMALQDPSLRRHVSSLAILLPAEAGKNHIYLIDASPDVREQLDMLRDVRKESPDPMDRAPVDGVFLTHAHIGHYLGLAYFGFEAVHTKGLPVYGTARMLHFLETNGPWSQLVKIGNVNLHELTPGRPLELPPHGETDGSRVVITPIEVPHRAEYSDTVAFLIVGVQPEGALAREPGPTILYVPDTEPWQTWTPSLLEVIEHEEVDVAILDGTFFSAKELPGRAVSSIGHPLITDSMDLLEPLVREGRLEVYFTHLNHSNPALDPSSAESHEIKARGFHVAAGGREFPL